MRQHPADSSFALSKKESSVDRRQAASPMVDMDIS